MRNRFVVGFGVASATFLMLLFLLPNPADAGTCTIEGYTVNASNMPNQYGTRLERSNVFNPPSDGGLVRSTLVYESFFDFVEVGWFEDGDYCSADSCDNETTPHVLVYARVDGGAPLCRSGTASLIGGEDYSFKVTNNDHNLQWKYYFDTDESPDGYIGAFSTAMPNGEPIMNDERKYRSDSLAAHFQVVNTLSGSGSWGPIQNPYVDLTGDDDGYVICSWSGTHLRVRPVNPGC